MYWINKAINPLKEGKYNCLADVNGLGILSEYKDQYFDGKDWCPYNSCAQFTRYWSASEEDFKIINAWQEDEYEKYINGLEEHSRNFGGL